MRAVRFLGERQAVVADQAVPRPGRGEVLVEIKAAGICGSDLHAYRARVVDYPQLEQFVPGHEPCGVVAEIGPDVAGWKVGDRVVVYPRMTCMECDSCRSGRRNLCPAYKGGYGFDSDGADAQFMAASTKELMPLPDDFTYLEGMLLACQVGTAYSPLKVMDVRDGDSVVVSGLGGVGLLAVLLARAMGAVVVGIDPSPERRALAVGLGADSVFDPAQHVSREIRARWPDGVDKLVETSGAPPAQASIVELLRPQGQAGLIGMGARDLTVKLMPVLSKELRIFGTSLYPFGDFDEIVRFIRGKQVPVKSIVTDEFELEDAPAGFRLADSARAGKVAFRLE